MQESGTAEHVKLHYKNNKGTYRKMQAESLPAWLKALRKKFKKKFKVIRSLRRCTSSKTQSNTGQR